MEVITDELPIKVQLDRMRDRLNTIEEAIRFWHIAIGPCQEIRELDIARVTLLDYMLVLQIQSFARD